MSEETNAAAAANAITLASLSILAYVAETLLHEAIGHGGICLLTGGEITLLAPLYMRCSVVTLPMVAAGPGMNLLVGLLSLLALRVRTERAGPWRYFLWLCFVFNWLVAAGYLLVGAATGFGDWSVILASVKPDWAWRAPAAVVAFLFYRATLALASRTFTQLTGLNGADKRTLARMILLPTGAAAIVALAAETYGQGAQPLGLALAFGCTLFVGLTLMGISGPGINPISESRLRIGFSPLLAVLAILLAAGFILIVGPGANLTAI